MSTRDQAWQERVQIARQAGRLGDLLVLVEEAPAGARRAEALIEAGEALRKAERFDFALEYLDRALQIEPGNLLGLREKDICLRGLALAGPGGHSPDRMTQPGQVLLFSGHIIDAPDRQPPRFPNGKAPIAGERIAAALDRLGAGPEDLSFSQASAGGDLLFLESCQQRGVRCRIARSHRPPTAAAGAPAITRSRPGWRTRTPFASCPTSLVRHQTRRARTNAVTCGCSAPRWLVAPRNFASSACGTGAARMGRAGPRTCTARSSAERRRSPGSTRGVSDM
jgi:hypothetical protein